MLLKVPWFTPGFSYCRWWGVECCLTASELTLPTCSGGLQSIGVLALAGKHICRHFFLAFKCCSTDGNPVPSLQFTARCSVTANCCLAAAAACCSRCLPHMLCGTGLLLHVHLLLYFAAIACEAKAEPETPRIYSVQQYDTLSHTCIFCAAQYVCNRSKCLVAGAGMVGTFPPLYESLPDLTLLFIANNPGIAIVSILAMSPGPLYLHSG